MEDILQNALKTKNSLLVRRK